MCRPFSSATVIQEKRERKKPQPTAIYGAKEARCDLLSTCRRVFLSLSLSYLSIPSAGSENKKKIK